MKKVLTIALLMSCVATFAQQQITSTHGTMTAAEFNAKHPKITDPKIYDILGNVVDSVKAEQMAKTFEYEVVRGKPPGQTEDKRVVKKINNYQNTQKDKGDRITFRPSDPKLWAGAMLDLTPLAKHTDTAKLQGKALVLLIRARQYPVMYPRINDAIANNIANNKFEVFAITELSYQDAMNFQKSDPILNAHNIVEAQDIKDFYNTGTDPVVVVTNTKHQIIYAVKMLVFTTPWVLNRLLKSL